MTGTGGPRDSNVWREKREIAKQLLARGLPASMVARQLGASRSWIQRVQQEMREKDQWGRSSAAC